MGFVDEHERRARLSKLGDPLERVLVTVDVESFRLVLACLLDRPVQGGCLAWDPVVVKVVVIQ